MIRANVIRLAVIGFGLIVCGKYSSAYAADVELLNPLGPVSSEEVKKLEARVPFTELGRPRSYYLAGSEELDENEMRVIALGSSNPRVQRAQVASCWLIELGNGDSFIFDIGTRCTINMSLLEVPWDKFTKVFISHLHADHFGDLPALLADGWDMGRSIPIEVWGPNGAQPELGTKAAVKHLLGMFRWDYVSKLGRGDMLSYAIKVHEFDFSREQTIYERNGVTIKSWPAVHTIDGAVSYSLEWNGLKLSYSGDTVQNKWFLKHAKNSDMVIHECSSPLEELIEARNFPPEAAWIILRTAHTQPRQAAEVFEALQPRMAVCFHYVDDGVDKREKLYANVVKRYDSGAFIIAKDMMVWNVTPEMIRVRMVVGGDHNANSLPRAQEPPDKSKLIEPSKWVTEGLEMKEIYRELLNGLKPEHQRRILKHVPKEHLP
jgi:ribonuclease Z